MESNHWATFEPLKVTNLDPPPGGIMHRGLTVANRPKTPADAARMARDKIAV
jgi:hypothetical protein